MSNLLGNIFHNAHQRICDEDVKHQFTITVVNKYHENGGQSVMRPSPLGNPYSHMENTQAQFKVNSREDAVAEYRKWLPDQIRAGNITVIQELNRLLDLALNGDLKLKCCCAPKECHANVVKEYLEGQIKRLYMTQDERLTQVDAERIFVFGSNTSGHHGAGAALSAKLYHGALPGHGEGHYGTSYALPTCGQWNGRRYPALPYVQVELAVQRFIEYAKKNPELTFKVTRVGCGLAGLLDRDMAPLFQDAPNNCLFDTLWKTWLPSKKFWGTF